MRLLVTLIATGLGSGLMRPFPGTWGTIPAWLIAYFAIGGDQIWLAVAAAACVALSVWSAGAAEKLFGHDNGRIVIDEWAGMLITLLFVPFSIGNYLVAFLAFRLFDVVKIPPARQAEKLPGGWGVTADDVIAGIQASLGTHLGLFLLTRLGWIENHTIIL